MFFLTLEAIEIYYNWLPNRFWETKWLEEEAEMLTEILHGDPAIYVFITEISSLCI